MASDEEIRAALAAPFPAEEIQWKPQTKSKDGTKALAVPYVDARSVEDRLDAVLGVGGWQDHYEFLDGGNVLCRLSVKVGGEWLHREDVGGPSEQPDTGDRMKAAVSDALKRAAVKWGVGRYIYSVPHQWVAFDGRKFTARPQMPAEFLPRRPAAQQAAQKPAPQQAPATVTTITEEQGKKIASLLAQAKTPWDTFRQHFKGVERLGQLTQDDYRRAVGMLEQEITTRRMVQQAAEANGTTH